MPGSARGLKKELIEAALAYGAAYEKYRAEWDRRPPEHVRGPDGTQSAVLDEAQLAACRASVVAGEKLSDLARNLWAQEREKQAKAGARGGIIKAVAP